MALFKKRELTKDEIPFNEMTPEQKKSYLWDYWRWPAFWTIVVLLVVVYTVRAIVTHVDPVINIVLVDNGFNDDFDEWVTDFAKYYGVEEKYINLSSSTVGSRATGGGYGSNYSLSLAVAMQAGNVDVVVIDYDNFKDYGEHGYFSDISKYIDKDKEDYIYLHLAEDDMDLKNLGEDPEEGYPLGVYARDVFDVGDSAFMGDAIIAIGNPCTHEDATKKFIEYLENEYSIK